MLFSTKIAHTATQMFRHKSKNLVIPIQKVHTNLARQPIEPVDMAYASYETSQSYNGTPPAPIIIMHGLFGSKNNWSSLSKAMLSKTSPQHKIIAVDARNHGDSPHSPQHSYFHLAEDIKKLLDTLNIQKSILIGHSMGGRAVMLCALLYPHLVEKLLVVDISPVSNNPDLLSMPLLFTELASIRFDQIQKTVPMSSAKATVDKLLEKTIKDKGLRAFLLTNLIQKPDKSYGWRINLQALIGNFTQHIANFPKVDSEIQYTGPTLFIGGGESSFIEKSDLPKIEKLFPRAELKYIDGAGHWLHSEKPAEFIEMAVSFINQP